EKGQKGGKVAGAFMRGTGHGVEDVILPNARSGYADIRGSGLHWYDRALNAISDASATVAVGGGLVGAGLTVASLSVVAAPVTVPAAAVSYTIAGIAGLVNVGANAVKGIIKACGGAGPNQNGGYFYDAAVGIGHLASRGTNHVNAAIGNHVNHA